MKVTKLPTLSSDECLYALQQLGFYISRQTDHHIQVRYNSAKPITIPIPIHHKKLPNGTLRSIMRHAGLNIDAMMTLLDSDSQITLNK